MIALGIILLVLCFLFLIVIVIIEMMKIEEIKGGGESGVRKTSEGGERDDGLS